MIPRLEFTQSSSPPAAPAWSGGSDFEGALGREQGGVGLAHDLQAPLEGEPASAGAPAGEVPGDEQRPAEQGREPADGASDGDDDVPGEGETSDVLDERTDDGVGEGAVVAGKSESGRHAGADRGTAGEAVARRVAPDGAGAEGRPRPRAGGDTKPADGPSATPDGEVSKASGEAKEGARAARDSDRSVERKVDTPSGDRKVPEPSPFKLVAELPATNGTGKPESPSPANLASTGQGAATGRGGPAPTDVGAQGVRGLSAVLQQGGGTLVMRLSPATLGALTIELDLSGTHVGVRVQASTAQAHELLSQQVTMLKSSLEAKGLTVDRLQVHIAPEAARAEAQQHPQGNAQDQGRSGRGQESDEQSHDASDGESRGRHDGGSESGDRHEDEGEARSDFAQRVRVAVDAQA